MAQRQGTGEISEGQRRRLKDIIHREGLQPVRLGKGGLGGGEFAGHIYWQEGGGMTMESMRDWWADIGRPEHWTLINWGMKEAVAEGERLPERGWTARKGRPDKGWDASGGIRLAVLVEGIEVEAAHENRLFFTIGGCH